MHPKPSCRRPEFRPPTLWSPRFRSAGRRCQVSRRCRTGKPSPRTRNSAVRLYWGGLRALLAGAGGVGLERADTFGQCSAAFGQGAGGRAVGRGVIRLARRRPRRRAALRREQGLDWRVRSFELHRELGHLGGVVVDAFAQQRVFLPLGRPGALGLLLDRVDVALELGALVAGGAELLLQRGLFGADRFHRGRRFTAAQGRDLDAQLLDGALVALVGLAELVVLIVALGEQLALRGKAAF